MNDCVGGPLLVGVEEKRDMMSAFAFAGLADDGVGARKSRSKMLDPAVGASGAAAAVVATGAGCVVSAGWAVGAAVGTGAD